MAEPISFKTLSGITSDTNPTLAENEKTEDYKSIFSSIDKNADGVVSAQEAKDYGFDLFEVKKDLTKEDFQTQLFKEHYNKDASRGVVFDVSMDLTDIEKNELLERIQEFEKYKQTLSSEELEDLEKNKSETLNFAIQEGRPDETKIKYKEFLAKYEKVKNGDFSSLTNEDIMEILNHTDTADLLQDGKIGSFNQGRTGDCWYLSMLNNYATTPEGAENIKNRISQKNGKYYVSFQNPVNPDETEKYELTKDDLKNYGLSSYDSYFSAGDLDVRIMEIATSKMLLKYTNSEFADDNFSKEKREYIENGLSEQDAEQKSEYARKARVIAGGDAVKVALVHKALGYNSSPVVFGRGEDLAKMYLNGNLEGMSQDDYAKKIQTSINDSIYAIQLNLSFKEESGKTIAYIDNNPENITDTGEKQFSSVAERFESHELVVNSGSQEYSDNEDETRYLSTGHVFNFENMDGENVTVNDPYNSGFWHTIPAERFDTHMLRMTYLPQK